MFNHMILMKKTEVLTRGIWQEWEAEGENPEPWEMSELAAAEDRRKGQNRNSKGRMTPEREIVSYSRTQL